MSTSGITIVAGETCLISGKMEGKRRCVYKKTVVIFLFFLYTDICLYLFENRKNAAFPGGEICKAKRAGIFSGFQAF